MIKNHIATFINITLLLINSNSFFCIFSANKQPLLIHIHDITKIVKDDSACYVNKWAHNPMDSCTCCLLQVKNNAESNESEDKEKLSADDILETCKHKNICNDPLISALKEQQEIPEGTSQQLLNSLYNDAVVIKNMDFDISLLDDNGSFTENSLPSFLVQAFNEEKLLDPNFSTLECLKVKNLATQGGFNTIQLFLVTATCTPDKASLYIVKEARTGLSEAIKLKTIESIPGMKDIIAPRVKPGFPSISLPLAYFSYPDKSKYHYIAAIPAAKGKGLNALIEQFKNDQSLVNEARLRRAFHILGKETGNFHKKFMVPVKNKIIGKTIVHGDFHPFNIFYDEIGGHCTYIDTESITRSMRNKVSPYFDMIRLLFTPLYKEDSAELRNLTEGINLKRWYNISLKYFIMGYIEAYPAKQRRKVLIELKDMFNDPILNDASRGIWFRFEGYKLPEFRAKYINPIFDKLLAQIS